MKNPFSPAIPVLPEDFIGRSSEISLAFDRILQRSSIAIWGSPGIGKSSFLKFLAAPTSWEEYGYDLSKVVVIHFSCLEIPVFTASDFWRTILKSTIEAPNCGLQVKSEVTKILQKSLETTSSDLRLILGLLKKENKFLVVLADDYDVALQPNSRYSKEDIVSFLHRSRSLAVHSIEGGQLSMIVTSLYRLTDLLRSNENMSPWYNHYLFLTLRPFNEEEALGLMNLGNISQTLKELLIKISGKNPALLQIAGSLALNNIENGELNIKCFVEEFRSAAHELLRFTWVVLSKTEKHLLVLIALSRWKPHFHKRIKSRDLDIIFSQMHREVNDLEVRGILEPDPKDDWNRKTRYHFASAAMEYWVLHEFIVNGRDDISSLDVGASYNVLLQEVRWLKKDIVPPIDIWITQVLASS